jgi:regulator of sirC expression with transglutaminase-like and TPR domain
MQPADLRQPFAEAIEGLERGDLAHAALVIARLEYPDLDVRAYLRRLDEMGIALGARLPGDADPYTRVAALRNYLFEEQGFHGNNQEYYDPRNSFLNDVLDRRVGIPITLSAVFLEVGRRVGLDAAGVSFPGHFLVRVEHGGGELLVDPFYGGVLLTEDDCQKRLDRVSGGRLRLQREHLAPCTPKHMLARMLANLKGIYVKSGDHARALGVMDLLVLVTDGPEQYRDRGLLYAAMDCYGLAADDLERYLKCAPRASDAESIRGTLDEMRARAARLN